MPGTSSYIQISRYALLEYQYNSEAIPVSASPGSAGALRLENKYTGTYQFLNTSQSVNLTGNVLDRSAARMNPVGNRWAYFDIDTAVPIYQINSNFVLSDLSNTLSPLAGRYDTARLHILSGFDFPGLDGLILQLQWKQWQLNGAIGNTLFDACNHVYLKGQEQIQFNATPLFLGDRLYDRYIDVKVPSLYDVNQDFWNSPTASNTIGYNYTFENVGFLQNSQIIANLYEIDSTEVENGNLYLIAGNSFKTAFNASDNYSQLGLTIQEDEVNDYIEYYPTWNGAFLETYINDLNSVGGDWVVINQLEVYEQVGTSSRRTANMTMLQDSNFDQPMVFRPVIMNSAVAFSYTIDYTMRFFNRVDNTEIIRKSAYTSTNVKKYGRQLEKINVLQGFAPVKVYNKIVQMTSDDTEILSGVNVPKEVVTQLVVTPVFYDTNLISVDSATDLNQSLGQTVWPQGTNTIFLGAFDNMLKFKVFTLSPDKKENVSFDMSSFIGNVALAFDTTDGNKLYIDYYNDINLADPSMGEVVFRVDSATAVKILASDDKDYYIINRTNPETVIYTGKWENITKKTTTQLLSANMQLENLQSKISTAQSKLASIQESIASAGTMVNGGTQTNNVTETVSGNAAVSTANAVLTAEQQAQQIISQEEQANLSQQQAATQAAIEQAASSNSTRPNINLIDIPGVTPNLGANPQISIRPNVENPADPNVGYNSINNPTKSGNTRTPRVNNNKNFDQQ
jgi:hypothetical protein